MNKRAKSILSFSILFILLFSIIFILGVKPAVAAGEGCVGATYNFVGGSTINESCTMNGSLSYGDGNLFTVGAHNIIIDGAGYSIDGDDGDYGIYNDGYNNVTIKNFKFSNFSMGVFLTGTDNCSINNSEFDSHEAGYGILSRGLNTIISNNTFNNSYTHVLVQMSGGSNNEILNNVFYNCEDTGLTVGFGSNNHLIKNNTFKTLTKNGLYIDYSAGGSNNTVVDGNLFYNIDSSLGAIYLPADCGNNYTIKNNNFTQNYFGLFMMQRINDSLIENNTFFNNSGTGAFTWAISNTTIKNNTFEENYDGLVLRGDSYNNTIYNNTFINQSNAGIWFDNIYFDNIVKNSEFIDNKYGIHFNNASNIKVIDSVISTSTTYDVYSTEADANNTLINVSFDKSKIQVSGGIVYVQWYLDVYVNNTDGDAVDGAFVTAYANISLDDTQIESNFYNYSSDPGFSTAGEGTFSLVDDKYNFYATPDEWNYPGLAYEPDSANNTYKKVNTNFTFNSAQGDYGAVILFLDYQGGNNAYYSCWLQPIEGSYYLGIYKCSNLGCTIYITIDFTTISFSYGTEYNMYFERNGSTLTCSMPELSATISGTNSDLTSGYDGIGGYWGDVTFDNTNITRNVPSYMVFNQTTNSSGYVIKQNVSEYFQNSTNPYYYTPYLINASNYTYNSNTTTLNITTNSEIYLTIEHNLNTEPIILEISPTNNSWVASRNVNFSYKVTDNWGIKNCSIFLMYSNETFIDIVWNTTAIINNTNYYENYTLPLDGLEYIWNVTCYDEETSNYSDTNYLKIGCGNLSTDKTYNNNVSIEGNCLNITGDNITVDGANNYLLSIDSTGVGIRGYSNQNITIKNINLELFETGIYIDSGSKDYNITNVTIISSSKGINIYGANNTIQNNNISSCSDGVLFYGNNNTFLNNKVSTISIYTGRNNTIKDSELTESTTIYFNNLTSLNNYIYNTNALGIQHQHCYLNNTYTLSNENINSTKTSNYGSVTISMCDDANLNNNNISGGMAIYNTNNLTITLNNITRNPIEINNLTDSNISSNNFFDYIGETIFYITASTGISNCNISYNNFSDFNNTVFQILKENEPNNIYNNNFSNGHIVFTGYGNDKIYNNLFNEVMSAFSYGVDGMSWNNGIYYRNGTIYNNTFINCVDGISAYINSSYSSNITNNSFVSVRRPLQGINYSSVTSNIIKNPIENFTFNYIVSDFTPSIGQNINITINTNVIAGLGEYDISYKIYPNQTNTNTTTTNQTIISFTPTITGINIVEINVSDSLSNYEIFKIPIFVNMSSTTKTFYLDSNNPNNEIKQTSITTDIGVLNETFNPNEAIFCGGWTQIFGLESSSKIPILIYNATISEWNYNTQYIKLGKIMVHAYLEGDVSIAGGGLDNTWYYTSGEFNDLNWDLVTPRQWIYFGVYNQGVNLNISSNESETEFTRFNFTVSNLSSTNVIDILNPMDLYGIAVYSGNTTFYFNGKENNTLEADFIENATLIYLDGVVCPNVNCSYTQEDNKRNVNFTSGDVELSFLFNQPPTISNVRVSNIYYDINLSCIGTYYDVEGDLENSSTYKWFYESGTYTGHSTKNITANTFSNGNRVRCEYTPCNNYGCGTAVNSSIQNLIASGGSTTTPGAGGTGESGELQIITQAPSIIYENYLFNITVYGKVGNITVNLTSLNYTYDNKIFEESELFKEDLKYIITLKTKRDLINYNDKSTIINISTNYFSYPTYKNISLYIIASEEPLIKQKTIIEYIKDLLLKIPIQYYIIFGFFIILIVILALQRRNSRTKK